MGGSVDGKKVLGKYPLDITPNGPLNIGRGRILPDTSWDAIWNGVSEWMGIETDEEKDYLLPTRLITTGEGFSNLMSKEDLFKAGRRERHLRGDEVA